MPDENVLDPQNSVAPAATEEPSTPPDAPAASDKDVEVDESTLDERTKAALAKVRREAANLRARIKDLEPAAAKLKEIQDKDKSESQRLTEQLAELNKEIAQYKEREVRSAAAVAAGLPPEMAQFITATDPAEAKAQAKQLAEWGKAGQNAADFKQGARPNTPSKLTGDDVLRRMAGRK
ncbi:MAG TPA: hypothetical protein VFX53_17075 [Pedococcus sp.]|nr:hypothetical protein [Pedococcus sp.]